MKKFDAVVFDIDSTLVKLEGLDWLADYKGKGKEIRKLTKSSMNGHLDFNTAMIEKMEAISPSYNDLKKLGQVYSQNIVDGAEEVISIFHSLGKEVWILTGNFQPAVGILARSLKISPERIICNRIFHTKNGRYIGFNKDNLLSKNGGKAIKIKEVENGKKKNVVYVGDSVTDLEVKGHISLFVGFGGVSERKIVKEKADIYLKSPSLYPLLKVVLTKEELKTLKTLSNPTLTLKV